MAAWWSKHESNISCLFNLLFWFGLEDFHELPAVRLRPRFEIIYRILYGCQILSKDRFFSFLSLAYSCWSDSYTVCVGAGNGFVDITWRSSAACKCLCDTKRGPVPLQEGMERAGIPRRKQKVTERTGYRSHLRHSVLESSTYPLERPLHHHKDGVWLALNACYLPEGSSFIFSHLWSFVFLRYENALGWKNEIGWALWWCEGWCMAVTWTINCTFIWIGFFLLPFVFSDLYCNSAPEQILCNLTSQLFGL